MIIDVGERLGKGPSKYQPEYCRMLVKHMRAGFSFDSFAGVILVSVHTLYNWVDKYPEFREAKMVGYGIRLYSLEAVGLNLAKTSTPAWLAFMKNLNGWKFEDQGITEDGKPIEIEDASAVEARRKRIAELQEKYARKVQDSPG